jgi:4-cresol dehydrogenase (hydroxylating)
MDVFERILGKENVVRYGDNNSSVQSTTFLTHRQALGAIYPTSRQEVQDCVKAAHLHKIRIYPISKGRNTGFGGRTPTSDHCVVMDLGKMNRILAYNETLAHVTVEPGVTQKQLVDFLAQQKSKLTFSATASFQDSSVVGNCLERGNTLGPLLERAEHICNLGIVLPQGDYINTGYGRFPNSKVKHVNKHGLGPDVTGLFLFNPIWGL